ncbi:APC family permease [Stutzerimonas stutzeri]|uniref:APC family permease n=1 Tax=Stutzerimonas stutzeri TaxID=316 RepID=UPI0005F19D81|nr:APC family permease [Stutzerimonas stutzeri]OWG38901.1 amino acid permease [Stutzerimonas stutzeri]RRV81279.1 APC family permease [Stutzerimonas stutzeri]RRV91853.1 APC family permease [Stutzerimonas stutzeri]RRV93348.1 APC family permease [Stutzerimonas stutzeri]RRV97465.1 APC family permease [Stutzerimonas stutzeri]
MRSRHSGDLSVIDGVAVLVGVVVGVGIFGFPPLVAQHADSGTLYIALWLAGGALMLVGALCYAELGASFPDEGGEYHYLRLAWGRRFGLMFAWARGTVIQTGAIAAVAFIYGDYAQRLMPLGDHGGTLHALLSVALLTTLNVCGTRESKRVQIALSSLTLVALIGVMLAGLLSNGPSSPAAIEPRDGGLGMLGMGMVFVLLTYGGWNETAYLSGELRNPARNMGRVLLLGTLLVTTLYLLTNLALLQIFGLQALSQSDAIGADLMEIVAGSWAAQGLSLLICFTALSTLNATILTGARVYYALGRDVPRLHRLAAWNERGSTPVRALLVQAAITLLLILFGALSQSGVQAMVAYTAPVFWFFMCMTALSLLRLRRLEPSAPRPFRVPWYPWLPLLFASSCLGLFVSSTLYAGPGALLGLLVLAFGLPLLLVRSPAAVSATSGVEP